jgi:hypothetical protein
MDSAYRSIRDLCKRHLGKAWNFEGACYAPQMSWGFFEKLTSDLAAFGKERMHRQICYLATSRKDGSPRVHPVTPLIVDGHLFVFMYPTSPKAHDLQRDGRFALHTSVLDDEGTGGEFAVTGRAKRVESAALVQLAESVAKHTAPERYILFEFEIETSSSTVYENGTPVRKHWKLTK